MNDHILLFRPAQQNSAYNAFFPIFRDQCGDFLQVCKVGAKNEQNKSNLIEQNKSFALNFSLEWAMWAIFGLCNDWAFESNLGAR